MKRAPRLAHVAVAVVKHGETGQRYGPSTNAQRQLCSLCLVDVERSQRCPVFHHAALQQYRVLHANKTVQQYRDIKVAQNLVDNIVVTR